MRRFAPLCLAVYVLALLVVRPLHSLPEPDLHCLDCETPGARLVAGCPGPCESPHHHHHHRHGHDHATCKICKLVGPALAPALALPGPAVATTGPLPRDLDVAGATAPRTCLGRAPPTLL